MEESSDVGVVVSGSVVVESGVGVEAAAGEEEGVGMIGIGGGDLAVDAVLVELDGVGIDEG